MHIQKDILTQNVLSQTKDEKQGISEKKEPIYNRRRGLYIIIRRRQKRPQNKEKSS